MGCRGRLTMRSIVFYDVEILEKCLEKVERHHKTGKKEIDFPDGTRKTILPSGREMSEFPDGVTVIEYPEVRGPRHDGRILGDFANVRRCRTRPLSSSLAL